MRGRIMFLVTSEEMREMDRRTIEEFGIPGRVLMENAGRGAARVFMERFPDIARKPVGVIAGRGNNGGDGFVIARYLAQAGAAVTVYLLADSRRLTGDALANFSLLGPLGIPVREITDNAQLEVLKPEMACMDAWVDAIFGTGLHSEVTGIFNAAMDFLNTLNRPVLAVDIPSGVNADTGGVCGICLTAALTVTFGFPKIGHMQFPGAAHTGELHVIDIGIPTPIAENPGPRQHLLTRRAAAALMLSRPLDTHKGRTGHVLVVAGSIGKTGAAGLCALGALRSGAGLVTVGVPAACQPVSAGLCMEAMTAPLSEIAAGALGDRAFPEIMDLLKDKKCLALGPGMGTAPETARLVARLVKESPVPIILDADGLNCAAQHPDCLLHRQSEILLTPHPGEMARLTGRSTAWVQENRLDAAREVAIRTNACLVLKGARTLIACPDGQVFVNPTGNPGMASAGMGDVLTGLLAGLIAQGCSPGAAARLGVYLHGLAADRLAGSMGPQGFLASDVANAVPPAMAELAAVYDGNRQSAPGDPIREPL